MAEDRDYIEEAQQEARLRFGRELSSQELAGEFAKHDLDTRVYHLKTLRDPSELTLNQAAKRHSFESTLRNTHETLRKVGR